MKVHLAFCGACTCLKNTTVIAYKFALANYYKATERSGEYITGTRITLRYIKRNK